MYITPYHQPRPSDPRLDAARDHFATHGPALVNAATLIGGDTAGQRVLRLTTRLGEARRLTRHLAQELVDLHRLLLLDLPGDIEGGAYDLALLLDPASRQVEEICLLADRLQDLLGTIAGIEDDPALAQSLPLPGAA